MKSRRSRKRKVRRILTTLIIVIILIACGAGGLFTVPRFRAFLEYRQAEEYMSLYDYDRAIDSYVKALGFDPKDAKIYTGLKKAYVSKGNSVYDRDYDRAMGYYENALATSKTALSKTGDPSFTAMIQEVEAVITENHRHDEGTYVDVKFPTCAEEGIRELRCNSCGEVIETVAVEALPHAPGDWQTETAADCTHEGLRVKKCTVCGAVVESEVIAKLPHEAGEWETVRESDCAPGLKVRKCVHCEEVVESEEIPAVKSHVKGSWETLKEPDCENPGERVLKCKNCENIIETEVIPANGHKKSEKGEKYEDTDVLLYKCTVCGKVLEPADLARVMYMETLPVTEAESLFGEISAGYNDAGRLVISFALKEETAMTDFGYFILNNSDLANGFMISYEECRNKESTAVSTPTSLNLPVTECAITDEKGDIYGLLSPSTVYYYRVFFIKDGQMYLSDYKRFITKAQQ